MTPGGSASERRAVVVVGGGSGIGRAAAAAFAARGDAVTVVGRRAEPLEAFVAENGTADTFAVQADVTNAADRGRMLGAAIERFGRLDVLVNAAGVVVPGPLVDVSPDDIRRMVEVNLTAPLLLYREAAPLLTGGSCIVSIGSVGGLVASRLSATYGATKAALHHLTLCLARELAPAGIRINTIVPGPVDTEFVDATLIERLSASTLVGRIGRPDDIARWILAVAERDASFVTGATLTIDGGFVIGR